MRAKRLFTAFFLGLGATLLLVWLLADDAAPATAAPGANRVERPRTCPLRGAGDVYCVAPISQTYAGCTRVFTSVQYAVDAATGGEVIKVAEGTYTDVHPHGAYTQVVYVDAAVTIRGGYTTTTNFADPPDPDAYPTTLDAGGQGRVVYVGNVTATLEGLRITNGVISGSVSDRGGGIYAFSPRLIISGCRIYSNTANNAGGGVWIQSDAATLVGNQIYSNTATSGGGIRFNNSTGATLTGNRIHDNAATQFDGGGISFNHSPDAMLSNNSVYSNTSSMNGGGMSFDHSEDALLTDNEVCSNTSQTGGGGISLESTPTATLSSNEFYDNAARNNQAGGGVYLYGSHNVTLTHNRVYSNTGGAGGGIYLRLSHNATLEENKIYSNTGTASGGGIYLGESPTSTLASNIVYRNTAAESSGQGGGGIAIDNSANITLVNNIIAGNRLISVHSSGAGIRLYQSDVRMLHTTLARNTGGDASGVYVFQDASASAALTNTILVSHTRGIVTSGCTATLEATLWGDGAWANVTDTAGSNVYTGTLNRWGDPAFVDPDSGDYHITGASAARDEGVGMTGVGTDIDGDARPFGPDPDIGADEVHCLVRLNGTYYPTVQAAVDASTSEADVVEVAGTCRGVQTRGSSDQVVYISKTLTVRGGYSPDFSLWDPDSYSTTLDAQGEGRVARLEGASPGSITPTLEALHLTNGRHGGGGGGIYSRFADTVISGCQVYSNTATGNNGGGVHLYGGPHAQLTDNLIHSNTAPSSYGGGLYLYSCDDATLRGNWVTNNAAEYGGGIVLHSSDAALINNVFADNAASTRGSGVYALSASPRLLHATIVRNTGGGGQGVYVSGSGQTAWLTNTILVSQTMGVETASGAATVLSATLWGDGAWVNGTDWGGAGTIVTGTLNWWGDPAFVDPDGGDYHLGGGSAAFERGIPAVGASPDIDGDIRSSGFGMQPDLGADEALPTLVVGKTGPAWLNPGAPVTYTLHITNTGIVTAHMVTLSDAIPSGAHFVGASGSGTPNIYDIVQWSISHVPLEGGAVTRTLTVTATQFISNFDYGAYSLGTTPVRGTDVITTQVNHAPEPNAWSPSSVHDGPVTLNSTSWDPDGHALLHLWRQTGGTPVGGPWTAISPTFTAPTTAGVLTFALTVTDTYGLSSSDTTTVAVVNDPPEADAGPNGDAVPESVVTLDGSGSSDPDNDDLDYRWSQSGGISVTLSSLTAVSPSFTAPITPGVLTFTLTVTDTFGEPHSDLTTVAVEDYRTYLPLVLRNYP